MMLASVRIGWNALHANDLFLDSWVLVHILGVVEGSVEQLPRAKLTLQYPLSYLPALPSSYVFGPAFTVRYAYPVVASLAAVPAYLLLRQGRAPALSVLALLLLPDLSVKALTGTPQGVGLPLFLLALYFALSGRRLPFVLAATAVLFTHHLTGMVTLILYYTVVAMPASREPDWLKREWPYLLYFGLWPLYWAWTFYQMDQAFIWPMFLILATVGGGTAALAIYVAVPHIERLTERLARSSRNLSTRTVIGTALVVGGMGWLIASYTLDSPGLSSVYANRAVVALYAALLVIGAFAIIARQHLGLTLLFVTLSWLGFLGMSTGCQRVFDGLRLADYAVLGGLVALFSPGLQTRWARPVLMTAIAFVFIAGGLRLQFSHERLFALSESEYQAAGWLMENSRHSESVATDTKMSLLVLGQGERHATFEGSRWLFDGTPVGPTITALNSDELFVERPISYVMLTDYMLARGADVGWFGPASVIDESLFLELDNIGQRVYVNDEVTIWRLDERLTSVGGVRHFDSRGPATVLMDRVFEAIPLVGRGVCG